MRIRWTTRIAAAVGVITMLAGVAIGGPARSAHSSPRPAGTLVGATSTASHFAGSRHH